MHPVQPHIDELRRRFSSVKVLHQTASEMFLRVEHALPELGCTAVLCVALDSAFPRKPPIVTYFDGRTLPISPTDGSTEDAWDPASSRLADAVANAFANLALLWGSVVPPSPESLAAQLSSLSDSMLLDIVSNPNCLESYAYQLPFFKAIRDASGQTLDEIERVANENLKLQPVLDQLRAEVEGLQLSLEQSVQSVQKVPQLVPLLNSISSQENLAKALATDVKALDAQREEIARRLLQVDYATDRRRFDALLEEYRGKAKERHVMDLKRRAYCASLK
ncbi:uncharacterized protein Tco025E_00945 [Trypanosoma conorhini]|uniref:VPS37 C-terminal domain-containing protein n=1 Tax=Trypanosoma conorhini TaxID=83891 RepID=A0A422QA58_9TRYP|nr:uncharacterized protein Tco025E_00945 [Trypanosoma conorhini]RNF26863.1 hypothetical protein Tco025E_00945 [Trypanosoma conorhini]